MPEAFSIGPFLVLTRAVGFLLLAFLALWMVHWASIYFKADKHWCSRIAEHGLWIGVIVSRLVFALFNWSSYAAKPWSLLYLWQPGYSFSAGVIGALAYILYRIYQQEAEMRRSIVNALSVGFTLPVLLFTGMLLTMNQFVSAKIVIPGDAIPNEKVTDLHGKAVSFAQYAGKGLVVNFWATWCPPCRREMPLLEEVYTQYQSQDLVVIGISVDGNRDTIKNYIESAGVSYPIWEDLLAQHDVGVLGTGLSNLFGVVGFPTTFFVDANGVIQSSYVGELNLAILKKRIPALLP